MSSLRVARTTMRNKKDNLNMDKKIEENTKYIEQLREWVNRQPHLPKDLDSNLLLRFAHSCYYDVEKAKKAMDMFFTIRGTCTEILTNRDLESAHMQKIFKIINLGQSRSVNGNKMYWFWQINDPGLETYDYINDVKLFFLSTDAHFLEDAELFEEDIVVMDIKDITLKFLTKINLSIQRKLSKYQEDGMPIRLKQIHAVNAPPFIDKIYAVVKPFIKKEITEMIHFHPPKSETLFKYISKEDLPADYGGLQPALKEQKEGIRSLITRHRETLISENFWRPIKSNTSTEASFRSLSID